MRFKLFLILSSILLVTYFTRDNYRSVRDIDPTVMRDPIQTEAHDKTPFQFQKNGFFYTVNPLYEYEITGIVVHRLIYDRWFSLSRTDTVFPMDLCIIWGDNVKSGVYREKNVTFSQDFRFCLYTTYQKEHIILNQSLSNNHLVIKDDDLYQLAQTVRAGDQIRIRGKLVDIKAVPLTKPERYEPQNLIWKTSTIREDAGAGACETIFVESIEILKRGNPISLILFNESYYGILVIIVWSIISFAYSLRKDAAFLNTRPK